MSVTLDVGDEPIPGLDADGRPDPAYAAQLGIRPAPSGRRSAAFALDATVWAVLALPGVIGAAVLASSIVVEGPSALLDASSLLPLVLVIVSQALLAVFGLIQLILHGQRGVTLGKRASGIRSVNVATFTRPGFWRVTLRALVLWVSQLVLPFVGPAVMFASSSWDPESRGRSWLDRIGGCYAVDARHGLDPFDAKALRHARRALDAPPATDRARLPSLATDRAPDEHTFIPGARSSSGVVSAGIGVEWTPPPIAPVDPVVQPATGAAPGTQLAAPAPAARDESTTGHRYVLVFDDGVRFEASDAGLIGRAPAPAAGEQIRQLVPLTDETMRISKTHAAFGIDGTAFWVADRSSKNGTVAEFPDGSSRALPPGVRQELPPGTRVVLGGRSFTLANAPEVGR